MFMAVNLIQHFNPWPAPPQLELVLYGDSIIRHARRLGDDFFDSVYNEWYDGTMAYGISGNTASEMLWCLRDGEFPRGLHPRAVVLLAGTNDVMHAHHPGVDEIESDDDSSQALTTIEVHTGSESRSVLLLLPQFFFRG
jgi:hypothetical protein